MLADTLREYREITARGEWTTNEEDRDMVLVVEAVLADRGTPIGENTRELLDAAYQGDLSKREAKQLCRLLQHRP